MTPCRPRTFLFLCFYAVAKVPTSSHCPHRYSLQHWFWSPASAVLFYSCSIFVWILNLFLIKYCLIPISKLQYFIHILLPRQMSMILFSSQLPTGEYPVTTYPIANSNLMWLELRLPSFNLDFLIAPPTLMSRSPEVASNFYWCQSHGAPTQTTHSGQQFTWTNWPSYMRTRLIWWPFS